MVSGTSALSGASTATTTCGESSETWKSTTGRENSGPPCRACVRWSAGTFGLATILQGHTIAAVLGDLGKDSDFGDLATRGRAERAVLRLLA